MADLDNDGKPEIGVAGRSRYQVFEHTGELKWSAPVSDISSEITGSSAFDFVADVDIDGKAEIVVVANEISGVAEPNRSTCSSRGMLGSRASAFHPTVFAMPVRRIYLKRGADVPHIQVLLGHSHIGTTSIYTKVDVSDLRRVLDKAHPREKRRHRKRVSENKKAGYHRTRTRILCEEEGG